MNRTNDSNTITGVLAGILLTIALMVAFDANAGWDKAPKADVDVTADAVADAAANANAASSSDASATGGNATSSNDGNTFESGDIEIGGDQVENNSSNVVLVPNNNTESCLRVIGIAWGENGKSGALGWPYRSKKCDFEQAADDAFAAGERKLGWYWKCQNKNLYGRWYDRAKGEEKSTATDRAKRECLNTAISLMGESTADLEQEIFSLRAELQKRDDALVRQRNECTDELIAQSEAHLGELQAKDEERNALARTCVKRTK